MNRLKQFPLSPHYNCNTRPIKGSAVFGFLANELFASRRERHNVHCYGGYILCESFSAPREEHIISANKSPNASGIPFRYFRRVNREIFLIAAFRISAHNGGLFGSSGFSRISFLPFHRGQIVVLESRLQAHLICHGLRPRSPGKTDITVRFGAVKVAAGNRRVTSRYSDALQTSRPSPAAIVRQVSRFATDLRDLRSG